MVCLSSRCNLSKVLDDHDIRYRVGPLEIAALHGHYEVVDLLLGDPRRLLQNPDISAIWCACSSDSTRILQSLIRTGYRVDERDPIYGWTPLHVAARCGQAEIVKILLEAGANQNLKDNSKQTPLYYALRKQKQAVIDLLAAGSSHSLTHSTSFDQAAGDRAECIALTSAKEKWNSASVRDLIAASNLANLKLLRESGWHVDSPFDCGSCTALILALRHRNFEVCDYLLDEGASLSVVGCKQDGAEGLTPGHIAARIPQFLPILSKILSSLDSPCALLVASSIEDRAGSLLHAAARHGNINAFELLLSRGAIANNANMDFNTPLHFAAAYGHTKALHPLLAAGANVNCRNTTLQTPFLLAAERRHVAVLAVLHFAGADVELTDHNLESPIRVAAEKESIETIRFLIGLGCSLVKRVGNDPCGSSAYTALIKAKPSARSFVLNHGDVLDNRSVLANWNRNDLSILRMLCKRYDQTRVYCDVNGGDLDLEGVWIPHCNDVAMGNVKIHQWLIEAGAMINLESGPEGTPLMAVCCSGRLELVKSLVRHVAVICYHKGDIVFSAVKAARYFPEVVRWLLVERYREQRQLPEIPPSSTRASTNTGAMMQDVQTTFVPTVQLTLDLVFAEERRLYLRTRIRNPDKVFICRHDGEHHEVEETVLSTSSQQFLLPAHRCLPSKSLARTPWSILSGRSEPSDYSKQLGFIRSRRIESPLTGKDLGCEAGCSNVLYQEATGSPLLSTRRFRGFSNRARNTTHVHKSECDPLQLFNGNDCQDPTHHVSKPGCLTPQSSKTGEPIENRPRG